MRRALLIFLALLVAAGAAAGRAIAVAADQQNNVALTQTVSYGNAAAAAGLQLESRAKLNSYQFWHTVLTPDGSAPTQTDFRYYTDRQRDSLVQTDKGYFYLFDYARMGMSSNQAIDLDNPYDYDMPYEDWTRDSLDSVSTTLAGLAPVLKQVAKNTAPGETHTETVRLADYMDYYPLAVDLNLYDYGPVVASPADMMQKLQEAFPIPVEPNDRPEISVTKDPAGNIVSLNVGGGKAGKTDELYTVSLVVQDEHTPNDIVRAKGRLLFAVCGAAAQKAQLPGGYGLYAIPWEETNYSGGAVSSSFEARIYPRIEPFCPLDAAETLLWMTEFDGGLLLVVRSGDSCLLKTLDRDTGALLHTLPLPQSMQHMDERGGLLNVLPRQDVVLVLFSDGQFALVEKTGDGLQVGLAGNYHDTEAHGVTLFYNFNDSDFAWDGDRLAIAGTTSPWHEEGGCDIHLAVFDQAGLAYAGAWQNSLGRNEGFTSSDKCVMPTNAAPLVLHWAE